MGPSFTDSSKKGPEVYLTKSSIDLAIEKPTNTNNNPNTLFAIMLANANFISPSLIRLKLSKVNVDRVVKLPRIPTNMKVLRTGEIFSISISPQSIPITNEPIRFTARVPSGKTPSKYLWVNPETK